MVLQADMDVLRPVLALNLEFSPEPAHASARIEVLERAGGRIARLALRGVLGPAAGPALQRSLDDLARRAVTQLVVDASGLSHLDFRFAPRFAAALERFGCTRGDVVVCGLSRYLRDILRASGSELHLHLVPSAGERLLGAVREGRVHGTAS